MIRYLGRVSKGQMRGIDEVGIQEYIAKCTHRAKPIVLTNTLNVGKAADMHENTKQCKRG